MKRIAPRIHETVWGLTHEGDGDYEHHYHVPDAPWLGHGTASAPPPEHVLALVREHAARHDAIHVTDGQQEVHALPRVTGLRIIEITGSDPPRYQAAVNVAWYDGDPKDVPARYGVQYVEELPDEYHETHHAHRLGIERRITVDLDGRHHVRDE